MKRREIEQDIIKKLHEIWDLYKKYNPDGTYLTFLISKCGNELAFSANNAYWAEDKEHAVECTEFEKEN